MLPKPRYGTFLSTLLGLGVQPNENDILQLMPSRCERSRGENGESGERLSRGRTELPLIASSCRLDRAPRSEEHTSELQSHSDLVCRLLLEKKKKKTNKK